MHKVERMGGGGLTNSQKLLKFRVWRRVALINVGGVILFLIGAVEVWGIYAVPFFTAPFDYWFLDIFGG